MKRVIGIIYVVVLASVCLIYATYEVANRNKKPTHTDLIMIADTNSNWIKIIVSNGVIVDHFVSVDNISNIQLLSVTLKTNI